MKGTNPFELYGFDGHYWFIDAAGKTYYTDIDRYDEWYTLIAIDKSLEFGTGFFRSAEAAMEHVEKLAAGLEP